MSSYYPSFNYMGINSLKDKNLIVVHFESGDSGEVETFLSMEPIYTENAYGTHRIDYGARYDSVAVIRITVMKSTGTDFTVAEVRDFLKWTTGVRKTSYLDLVDGDVVKFSYLGRVTNVWQQKLDARTIGLILEFTATSPWAYSPEIYVDHSFGQTLVIDDDGVIYKSDSTSFSISDNGILNNDNNTFKITDDGTAYIDNSTVISINNPSDDLYTFVNLKTILTNNNSDYISIHNITTNEETIIKNMKINEVITLEAEQFIISDIPNKIFGDDFNFVWPRLQPGVNELVIGGAGEGHIKFIYRYPIKIGDCAIDIDVYGDEINCGECPDSGSSNIISGPVTWNDITNTPTTIEGYGITNAYTMTEVDTKLKNLDVGADMNISENELDQMLVEVLGE